MKWTICCTLINDDPKSAKLFRENPYGSDTEELLTFCKWLQRLTL